MDETRQPKSHGAESKIPQRGNTEHTKSVQGRRTPGKGESMPTIDPSGITAFDPDYYKGAD